MGKSSQCWRGSYADEVLLGNFQGRLPLLRADNGQSGSQLLKSGDNAQNPKAHSLTLVQHRISSAFNSPGGIGRPRPIERTRVSTPTILEGLKTQPDSECY